MTVRLQPQENGNKTDVRWVAMTDKNGAGLLAVGMPLLSVSAWPFTMQDMENARHIHELPNSLKMVAYQSENKITNKSSQPWEKETGLLSIWILGMFNPSSNTTVVCPFRPGPESKLGPKVNDAYFGKVPADRLVVKDNVLFFSADGKFRSKIGLSPQRAKPILGSYDAANKSLH